MILWIYTCRALVLIYLVPKGHCNVFYATIRQSELSTIPHVVTHFRLVSRCTLSCPAFGNQRILFAEYKTLLFFFQKEVLCFLSCIKIKKCWQLWSRLLRFDTFLAALRFDIANKHTHTHTHTHIHKDTEHTQGLVD